MSFVDDTGGPEDEGAFDVEYSDVDADLVTATERTLALSYLMGMEHASPDTAIDLADTPEPVSFTEAAEFMKNRIPLTKKEWNAIEPKLRFRAFTVAALSTPDAIESVKGMVVKAVEEGKSKAEFWTETRALEQAGLTNAAPFYWENVYRTNIQTAYNAGRAAEFMRESPEYIEFVGIDDGRQTELCYSLTHPAVVLPATHPFWQTHWPPLHFRCRSTTRGMYPEEVAALRESNPSWAPSDSETIQVPETVSGFGGNPLDSGSFWKLTPAMKDRAEEYGLLDKIEHYAKSLGLPLDEIVIGKPAAAVTVKSALDPHVVPAFKTVKEAESWVTTVDLADECSFSGCDVPFVQECVQKLKSILDEYPEARENMQFFGTIQKRNALVRQNFIEQWTAKYVANGVEASKAREWATRDVASYMRKYRIGSNDIAQYARGGGVKGISINQKYAKLDQLENIVRQNVEAGWFPKVASSPMVVLDHETGHLLDDIYGLSNDADLLSYWKGTTIEQTVRGLSRYGTKNIKEFVAEAWSEYKNSKNPREIASTVAKLLNAKRSAR